MNVSCGTISGDQSTCGKRVIQYTTTSLFTQGGSIKGGVIIWQPGYVCDRERRRRVCVCVHKQKAAEFLYACEVCSVCAWWFLGVGACQLMVQVYSGPFPAGFGLYLEMICVFLVRAILERLCHGGRCCVFALDLLVSSSLLLYQLILPSLVCLGV